MFNVGDLVRAKKSHHGTEFYAYTNSLVACKVLHCAGPFMEVGIVGTDRIFTVMTKHFELELINLENE